MRFPNANKVLIIADTNLVSAQNIAQMCQSHSLVVLIDHHTSFLDFQKELDSMQIKNFVYLFDQQYCASELTLVLLDCCFRFRHRFEVQFSKDLQQQISYVSANDLKTG